MQIETKYNVGDLVYVVVQNTLILDKISKISVVTIEDKQDVWYSLQTIMHQSYKEERLFKSLDHYIGFITMKTHEQYYHEFVNRGSIDAYGD